MPGCAISIYILFLLFCKTTNGARPAGAPLVCCVTNGAWLCGAPLVTWDQVDILDSHITHSLSPLHSLHLLLQACRLPPPPHLICTIDSSKLSGEITFF